MGSETKEWKQLIHIGMAHNALDRMLHIMPWNLCLVNWSESLRLDQQKSKSTSHNTAQYCLLLPPLSYKSHLRRLEITGEWRDEQEVIENTFYYTTIMNSVMEKYSKLCLKSKRIYHKLTDK